MLKKKQAIPANGAELYKSTKLHLEIYLEAALLAGEDERVIPTDILKIFRVMVLNKQVKELVG